MDRSFEKYPRGTLIDRTYRIERLIGEGGMARVYEATQVSINRRVAIKLLKREPSKHLAVVERFHREATVVGTIQHDNICEVTDLGQTNEGIPYLVMPYLEGETLSELLNNSKQLLSYERFFDIIDQTLSALEAAHARGVIHRDLKPENIFVIRLGKRDDFVKLLDFGISQAKALHYGSSLTITGTVLGTPSYMSPEQARGSREIDERTDIYSLGVIMYEALTGIFPFMGETYNEVMYRIMTDTFLPPCAINSNIPTEIEEIVCKAISRQPDDRFASIDEMRSAISKVGQTGAFEDKSCVSPLYVLSDDSAGVPSDNLSFADQLLALQSEQHQADDENNQIKRLAGKFGDPGAVDESSMRADQSRASTAETTERRGRDTWDQVGHYGPKPVVTSSSPAATARPGGEQSSAGMAISNSSGRGVELDRDTARAQPVVDADGFSGPEAMGDDAVWQTSNLGFAFNVRRALNRRLDLLPARVRQKWPIGVAALIGMAAIVAVGSRQFSGSSTGTSTSDQIEQPAVIQQSIAIAKPAWRTTAREADAGLNRVEHVGTVPRAPGAKSSAVDAEPRASRSSKTRDREKKETKTERDGKRRKWRDPQEIRPLFKRDKKGETKKRDVATRRANNPSELKPLFHRDKKRL